MVQVYSGPIIWEELIKTNRITERHLISCTAFHSAVMAHSGLLFFDLKIILSVTRDTSNLLVELVFPFLS